MKKIIVVIVVTALMINCGEKKKETSNSISAESNTINKTIPIDLTNKGIGPIKAIAFGEVINEEMVAIGKKKFNTICSACHMVNQRLIGPALANIYERRSPEWVMNMILNPEIMTKEDPIAKALIKEYNNTIMINQNLNKKEVRAIAEYLRTL